MAEGNMGSTKESVGAWVVHHGQKTAITVGAPAEFPAIDTASKAASLLSQLAASEELTIEKIRLDAHAKAAGLNPRTELPSLIDILARRRLIDQSKAGDVAVLGLTSRATVTHAADIFEEQQPSPEERAAIKLAELTSDAPRSAKISKEYISDIFKFPSDRTSDFIVRAEGVGFIDAEGHGDDKLFFNGNLFRRGSVDKVKRVLDSLSAAEQSKARELDQMLRKQGCVALDEAEKVLGRALFEKLKAAALYDVNTVSNSSGEFSFVTRPAAFHKFNDPLVDDAFDLAKALVAALTYGITQSAATRGRITMINALLRKLIQGGTVGPATAIGEDYRVLEMSGVIRVAKAKFGYTMRLLKRDIGEMALGVLTTGDAASTALFDRPLPGAMTGFVGPEASRMTTRKKQLNPSRRMTQDVLNALRTEGSF